jgi:hypothetical protein
MVGEQPSSIQQTGVGGFAANSHIVLSVREYAKRPLDR